MANNFSTLIENKSLDIFQLVRINPTRLLQSSNFVSLGSNLYEIEFPYIPSNLTVSKTDYTQVTTTPTSEEFSYNETNQKITVYLASAPSNFVITVDYYIFLTTKDSVTFNEEPEDSNSSLRFWNPRLNKKIGVTYDLKEVVNGILSVNSTNIEINNIDGWFNQYTTKYDSFNKKPVQIWDAIDNLENIQKAFKGRTGNISVDEESVSIDLEDEFTKLNTQATMGDNSEEVTFQIDTYPNLQPNAEGRAIKYIFGKSSVFSTKAWNFDSSTPLPFSALNTENMEKATCIDYVEYDPSNPSGSREWVCCRIGSEGTQDFSDTVSVSNIVLQQIDSYDALYRFTVSNASLYQIGDNFEVTQGGNTIHLFVQNTDQANNYIYLTNELNTATGLNLTAGQPDVNIVSNDMPSIVIRYKDDIDTGVYPREFSAYYDTSGTDQGYTATTTTTSGGNKLIKITFGDLYEGIFGIPAITPDQCDIFYRVKPKHSEQTHGKAIKKMIEKAGIDLDTTSINQVDTDLSANVKFSIPNVDETEFGSYLSYCQDILKSTLGYFTLNKSFEIEYNLFETPSTTDIVDENKILKESYSYDIEYDNLTTGLIAYNPHFLSDGYAYENPYSSNFQSSEEAEQLHGIVNVDRFKSPLELTSTLRLADIFAIKSQRYLTIKIKTKFSELQKIIGDDLQIEYDGKLPGNVDNIDAKIVSISQNSKDLSIILTDLYDL